MPRTSHVLTDAKLAEIEAFFMKNPRTSLRKGAQQLNVSISTLWKAVRTKLKMKPFRMSVIKEVKEVDRSQRLKFCRWIGKRIYHDKTFLDNVWFSDEAHFHLHGHVNSWNTRIWAKENPRVSLQVGLHSPLTTVWCAISRSGIIGPFFFDEIVKRDNYLDMLATFFVPELQRRGLNVKQQFFQQDGASPHTANTTILFLKEKFPNNVISKGGDINWPSRSPDLTPPDFYLWGALKEKVYHNGPKTLDQLRINIQSEIHNIDEGTLHRVFHNLEQRFRVCCERLGDHVEKYTSSVILIFFITMPNFVKL